MSDKHKPRTGQDRRKKDKGAPTGWKERRRTPERRMPEVEEISVAEFMRLMAENKPPAENPTEDSSSHWDKIRKF